MRVAIALSFLISVCVAYAAPLGKKSAIPPPQSLEIIQIVQGYAQIRNSAGLVGWVPVNVLSTDGSQVSVYQRKLAHLEQEMSAMRAKLNATESQMVSLNTQHQHLKQWILPASLGMLVAGFILGVGFFRTRFHKRLNGLRI